MLQTADHGSETLHVGDVRVVPPDTPMQLRNESDAEAGFLALLVADATRPFLAPASFESAPVVQPNPSVQPSIPQPSAPARLPNTGGDATSTKLVFIVSVVVLLTGIALRLRSRKRNSVP